MVSLARSSSALLDGLSFPLSLAWALTNGGVAKLPKNSESMDSARGELHIVVLGATARAEVRLWLETQYWQELSHLLADRCTPCLHFVGPEVDLVSGKQGECVHQLAAPCAKRFFKDHPEMTPQNTVCTVYNGGFGNFVASGHDSLLWSWLADLEFLLRQRYLCVFFCANDYADVKGETAVHASLLGSSFVLSPQRNPFAMATVYQGDSDSAKEWFNGNSFVYAVCGCERDADSPSIADAGNPATRKSLLDRVLKQAQALADGSLAVYSADPPVLRPSPSTTSEAARAPSQPAGAGCGHAQRPESSLTFVIVDGCRWLRLEILLPGVESIDAADLQISDASISFSGVGVDLQETLPESIHSSQATAAFSAKRGRLVIKAPLQKE